jgi:outer membrane protein TolC
LVSFERLRTLDAALLRTEQSLAELQILNREGFAEQLDVDRLRVQHNNLRAQREKVTALCEISLNLLKFQMGYPVAQSIELSDSLSALVNLRALPLESGFDVSKRPEMQLLMLQQTGLNLEIKSLKSGKLPSLAIQAQRGALAGSNTFRQVRDPGGSWFAYGSVGLGLNWNVFDSFTKKYKIQQKKIELTKSLNQTDQFRQAAWMEEAHAITQLRNQIRTLESQEENLRLSRQILSVTQTKYREGVGSGLEVTAAESALTEAESGYFGAVYDWLMARVDLEKARGSLLDNR